MTSIFRQPAAEEGPAFVACAGAILDDILCEQYQRKPIYDTCVSFEVEPLQIPVPKS